MKILILLGSRNPEGQTARAAAAFAEGVAQKGGEVDTVILTEIAVERCRQCEANGWGDCREKGSCVIDDDFAGLVDRIAAADAVAFATPVYYGDLSESMRALLDRLRRTCTHPVGRQKVEGKPVLGIGVAGGGGGGSYTCCASLDKVLNTCGFDVIDVVPVRRQNLEWKVETLRQTGTWPVFAEKGGTA